MTTFDAHRKLLQPYRHRVSLEMWAWWDETLTDDQRHALLRLTDDQLTPDHALELWRTTGVFRVIVGIANPAMKDGYDWRLAPDVADFVSARGHEQRHPEDFH